MASTKDTEIKRGTEFPVGFICFVPIWVLFVLSNKRMWKDFKIDVKVIQFYLKPLYIARTE